MAAEEKHALMTPELLTEFGETWTRHDPDLLMRYMADDCRIRVENAFRKQRE